MTTLTDLTFTGSNFQTGELIKASEMNDKFAKIVFDLNYHLSMIQTALDKLNTIEPGASAPQSITEMIGLVNASVYRLAKSIMPTTVGYTTNLTSAITAHQTTTHGGATIRGGPDAYTTTPSGLVTSSTRTMLDEVRNLQRMLYILSGLTGWTDTPARSLGALYSEVSTFTGNKSFIGNIRLMSAAGGYNFQDTDYFVIDSSPAIQDVVYYLPSAVTYNGRKIIWGAAMGGAGTLHHSIIVYNGVQLANTNSYALYEFVAIGSINQWVSLR
ncbi:MAG: hypothetical protein PHT13_00195 [Methanosarcina sp.]|nr:hypothetical protein [Methanosarcina sp.]